MINNVFTHCYTPYKGLFHFFMILFVIFRFSRSLKGDLSFLPFALPPALARGPFYIKTGEQRGKYITI